MTLTEDEARSFAYDDHPDYDEVETIIDYDVMYKDYAPATTISKKLSDGTFWALDWDSYQSHYGSGESMFNSNELRQVKQIEKVITTKEWINID